VPIHHAVLGLLADGPSYGYELKGRFEEAVGPQWGELNIGHLYQVLERLARDGLVTRREVPQRNRPDRVVYRLTPAGREELDRWLGKPVARQGGYRDDFFLKLFVSSRLGQERLRETIRAQREAYMAELAALAELRVAHRDDPLVSLLIEAASLHTRARLQLADRAEEQAGRLTEAAAANEPGRTGKVRADAAGGVAS